MKNYTLYLFSVLWLLGISYSFAQKNKKLDSLLNIITKQNGIEKIDALNELAWELKDSTGINYALEAIKLSEQQNYYKGTSDAYNRLGRIVKKQGDLEASKVYYSKALTLDVHNNNMYNIARAKNELAIIYKRERKYVKALDYFLFSLDVFVNNKEYEQAAIVSGNIGRVYKKQEIYEKSRVYYEKQLKYSVIADKSNLIAKSYRNLGDIYKDLRNYESAQENYRKAEKIYTEKKKNKEIANILVDIANTYDYLNEDIKSKETFHKALSFFQKYPKLGDKGAFHFNFGTLYSKLGQKDSASYHYKKAEAFFLEKNDKEKLLVYYNNIGNVYTDYKEYEKALSYFNQSLILQNRVKDSSMLAKTYESMSNVFEELKNHHKALKYKDSAYTVRSDEFKKIKQSDQSQIASINNEKKLITIKSEKAIIKNREEKLKLYTIGLLVALFLLTALFFFITKARKQRQKRVLAEADLEQQKLIVTHEKERQEQQIQELIKIQEMNAINAMISGQEEERKRIAQDLHDNLGSKLSLVKIHYQSVEDNLESIDDEAKTQYEKANQLLDEACKSVREISHNMISGTLSKFGLIPALKELKQTLENVYSKQNQNKIYIELSYHKLDNRLVNTMEIQIYRIIQELLNNIIKHAQASRVDIQILKLEQGVNIIVEDDGIGFEVDKLHEGIGLKTIQSRVINMKGSCLIDSGKGNGTTVTIDIPT
ncbi:sensor histidine kinase [uncultured Kordia sp.]|uniref:ATP-binding protein n=1 Tax=uncultured Kordia sp. TaxID=507699 RepID=UPI00260850BA|nr:sensor histidine kinase [uncultured Kordia sp.]